MKKWQKELDNAMTVQININKNNKNNEKIATYFFNAKCLLKFLQKDKVISIKIDTEQNHKDGDYPLNVWGISHYAIVFYTKTTSTGSTKRCSNGIK